jgi:D-Tyr-tRNAtyr deacylase
VSTLSEPNTTYADTHSAVLQRVTSASVTVDQQLISSVGRGLLVFAAIGKEDTEKDADSMAAKVLKARLWPDENKPESSVCHSCRMQHAHHF